MSINDFPDPILGLIFKGCDPGGWKTLEQVCVRWKTVAKSHLGNLLIRGTGDGANKIEIMSHYLLLNRSVLKTEYSESVPSLVAAAKAYAARKPGNTDPDDPKNSEELEKSAEISTIPAINPDSIRRLSFVGPVQQSILTSIITLSKTLSALHIHFSALSLISDFELLHLDCPTLQTLVFETFGIKEDAELSGRSPNFLNFSGSFRALLHLLCQNHFPNLRKLILSVPFCEDVETDVMAATSGFLFRHGATIRSFCYHQAFEAILKSDDSDSEGGRVPLRALAEYATALKSVSLKNIQVHLACPQESDPLWKNFILHQKQLEKLIFTGTSRIPFPTHTVHENRKTLQTLVLDIRDNVDIQTLSECHNLKKLVLLSNPQKSMILTNAPNAKNLSSLPPSLETLSLRHLTILRSDAESLISGRLPLLKSLELFGCGNEDDFGVPIQMIGKIWEMKVLLKFAIRFSLNRNSLKERPLPPSVALLAYALEENYSITQFEIDGLLDTNGNYGYRLPPPEESALEQFQGNVFTFPDELDPYGGTEVMEFGEDESSGDDSSDSEDSDSYDTIAEALSSSGTSSDSDAPVPEICQVGEESIEED